MQLLYINAPEVEKLMRIIDAYDRCFPVVYVPQAFYDTETEIHYNYNPNGIVGIADYFEDNYIGKQKEDNVHPHG